MLTSSHPPSVIRFEMKLDDENNFGQSKKKTKKMNEDGNMSKGMYVLITGANRYVFFLPLLKLPRKIDAEYFHQLPVVSGVQSAAASLMNSSLPARRRNLSTSSSPHATPVRAPPPLHDCISI